MYPARSLPGDPRRRRSSRAREAVGPRRVGGVPAAAARPTNSPDPGRRERWHAQSDDVSVKWRLRCI